MLIVFEGVDNSGKSTLSVDFQQYINTDYRSADGTLKIDPHFGDFIWTKEPTFTSEEADQLNSPGHINEYKRERIFFESRLRHQGLLSGKNVICDRYIWSGLAYALKFSPNCYEFVKELYLCEPLFIQPDLYVFVDTPPEVCYDRDASVGLDRLRSLREAFVNTKQYLPQSIITLQAIGGEKRTLKELVELFEEHVKKNHLLDEDLPW